MSVSGTCVCACVCACVYVPEEEPEGGSGGNTDGSISKSSNALFVSVRVVGSTCVGALMC